MKRHRYFSFQKAHKSANSNLARELTYSAQCAIETTAPNQEHNQNDLQLYARRLQHDSESRINVDAFLQ